MSDIEKEVYAKRGYILAKHYNKKLSQLYYFLKYKYYKRKNEKNFLKNNYYGGNSNIYIRTANFGFLYSRLVLSGNGLVWFRALGLGPRDFGGSNPPYPTIRF